MNKLFILCCINIITIIHAASLKSDIKIYEFLQQIDFSKECPAVLSNNIDKHKSDGGLSHCKNVSIGNPPPEIGLTNLNEFYCIGLLAADIQLCSGNKTNKITKNPDEFKANLDKIKLETPIKICNELKQLKLFNYVENVISLKQWIKVLDKNLHESTCAGLCTDIENGNTNLLCSLIYYINNNISYVTITEKTIITSTPKPSTFIPPINKDNEQHKSVTKEINLVEKSKITKPEESAVQVVSSANTKENVPSLQPKIDAIKATKQIVNVPPEEKMLPPINKNQVIIVDKSEKVTTVASIETTTIQNEPIQNKNEPIQNKNEPITQVKTIQITEESKQPVVNQIPVEENQKPPTNVESSSVSSTISGVREDLGEDYFEEMEEINKDNDDQLIPQTNSRKETIEILANDQDRHRMPSEENEDMEDSNFFSYFMFVSVMFIAGYVVYHNKQKIMALLLEGRRDRNSRRRPNTASYRKLNSNLEEAVTSKCSGSASHVIY